MKYIITCNENSQSLLIEELKRHNTIGTIDTWLSETEAILISKLEIDRLVEVIKTTPVVFVRHLFPVDGKVDIAHAGELMSNLNLEPSLSFSFQIRTPQHLRKEGVTFRNECVDTLVKQDYTLNVKYPQQIVSLYFSDTDCYYGVGKPNQQLSKWSAGEVHFSKSQASISRAEYKLREVFDAFDIPNTKGIALDLGAAPGGWTQVLHDEGFSVIAIDPAKLDPRVAKLEGVTHYKDTAQAFLSDQADTRAQLIVNDMKMTSRQSIALFVDYGRFLTTNGFGVITIKLPKEHTYFHIEKALQDLKRAFKLLEARQLFHNRNEFTALIAPR